METQQNEPYHLPQIGLRNAYTRLTYQAKNALFIFALGIFCLGGLAAFFLIPPNTAMQGVSVHTSLDTESASSTKAVGASNSTSNQDDCSDLYCKQPFAPGARFVFDEAEMSFTIPASTVSVKKMRARNDGKVLYITMEDDDETTSIEIATNQDYAEWNNGLPFEKLESETVTIDGKDLQLRTYRVLQADYLGAPSDEKEYFVITLLLFDGTGNNASDIGRALYASYETAEQKMIARDFIDSISFKN